MSFKTINWAHDYCLKSQNLERKKEKKKGPQKPTNYYYMYLLVCVSVCVSSKNRI